MKGADYLELTEKEIQPQDYIHITPNERMYIAFWGISGTPVFRVQGKVLLKNGSYAPFQFRFTPTADSTIQEAFRQIPAGYLVQLTAFVDGYTAIRGAVFVHISIVNTRENQDARQNVLIQQHLTNSIAANWKQSTIQSMWVDKTPVSGSDGTDQAAGVEVSETVPTGQMWKLVHFRADLVSAVAAANRYVALQLVIGGRVIWNSRPFNAQTASLTRTYNWHLGQSHNDALDPSGTLYHGYLPDIWIPEGTVIRTQTLNLQAEDNWGAPTMGYEIQVVEQ